MLVRKRTLGQHVSNLLSGVQVCRLNVRIRLDPLKKPPSKSTRCVVETRRVCGLRPLMTILMTASTVFVNEQKSTIAGCWCVRWDIINGFLRVFECFWFELTRSCWTDLRLGTSPICNHLLYCQHDFTVCDECR